MTCFIVVGMGIDSLSMSSPQIARIKSLILRCGAQELKGVASEALKKESVEEVRDLVEDFMRRRELGEFISHSIPTA